MSIETFKSLGLHRLTQEEAERLNRWFNDALSVAYRKGKSEVAVKNTEVRTAGTPNVIESHLEDDFEGWEGETVFKLTNGQIWQQSSYAYTYHYAFMPEVLIYKTAGGYKMKVDGVRESIYVIRLK